MNQLENLLKSLLLSTRVCVLSSLLINMALLSLSMNTRITPQNHQGLVNYYNNKGLDSVRNLVQATGVPSLVSAPHVSLQNGNWVKLICGASFEDVVDVRNLSLVYTLAGVDCIDCAADESVVNAVNDGIETALQIMNFRRPWVMVSVNDDEDLHFRKAEFDPEDCPADCSRPCEFVCPANAISLTEEKSMAGYSYATNKLNGGVITERCYGCGRCFPVCPYDKIKVVTYVRDAATTAELLERNGVDAIEIHTSGRQTDRFKALWEELGNSSRFLKLVAVSLPHTGNTTISTMKAIYSIMESQLNCFNLWQLDGRPMSGDIGRGATKESISFAVHLASAKDRPPGFLQLAGGTNIHTVDGLKKERLFKTTLVPDETESAMNTPDSSQALIGGIAYGGYARKIVGRVLNSMEPNQGVAHIENQPDRLLEALRQALNLVGTVKCYDRIPLV